MSDIINISPERASLNGPARLNGVHAGSRQAESSSAAASQRADDRVELSERSRLLSQLRALPEVRTEVVDRVRAEIEADTYLTDAKVDAASDELADDIDLFG
jgi:hypothetical protein